MKVISDTKIKKTIQKGDVLFNEGKKLNGIFCVGKGVTKLYMGSENGRSHIVKIAN